MPSQALERPPGLPDDMLPAGSGRVLHLGPGLVPMADGSAAEPAQPCDVLVLHHALQGCTPLALLEAADRLCAPTNARLLVLDRFTLQQHGTAALAAPLLGDFIVLARRFGWRLEEQRDGGAQALPEQGAAGLPASRLLRLERPAAPPLRLAAVQAADADAMRRLFEQVFGHAMGAAEWQWKYGSGRGVGVGLYRGTEMLAHYGGLSRPLLLMGQPGLGCQVGDVMVAPAANAGLGRRLALHDVAATLLEAEIGWGRRHAVGFGFPNARHMRLAERLGLYAPVDGITQLSWAGLLGAAADEVEAIDAAALQPASDTWQGLQAAWVAMAQALATSVLGVRDPAWLHYRYGQRPGVRYPLLLLRERPAGKVLGAVVLRAHADRMEVMDLIAHPTHFPRLLRLARASAASHGLPCVQAWVSSSHAALLHDAADPAQAEVLDVTVPANVHTPGWAPAALQNRWFLMAGDTDFR